MRNIKEYKAPTAQITEFECAEDIMTASRTLYDRPNNAGDHEYVYAGSIPWSKGLGRDSE